VTFCGFSEQVRKVCPKVVINIKWIDVVILKTESLLKVINATA
jgi:hypothetical protein